MDIARRGLKWADGVDTSARILCTKAEAWRKGGWKSEYSAINKEEGLSEIVYEERSESLLEHEFLR